MRYKEFFSKGHILGIFLIFIVQFIVPIMAQELPSKLVSTEWLNANLSKENLRIIDVRDNVKDYWRGHIPGAVYYNPDAVRLADHGVPVKLIPPEILVVMLGKLGINEKTMIVLYTEQGGYKAPYIIWALDYIGHSLAAILEGGFSKWEKEGCTVIQDYPEIAPTNYLLPTELHKEVRATLEEVKKVVEGNGGVLLDVRPVELYTGQKGPWKRQGHIKGAINHFWGEDLKDDGTWKNNEELKKAYEMLGITPGKLIVVSCGKGLKSAHTYFTLKYILGYSKVKNYDGSFNEWSNIDELPVETDMK